MHFIFDNLSAILIGSAIFLTLAAVDQRSRMATVDSSMFYALKQQQLSFIEIIQHDLNAAVSVNSISIDPASGAFRFQTRPDPASPVVGEVVYTRIPVDEVDGVAYVRIARSVNGVESGSSAPFVTGWNIQLLNGEGNPVNSVANGREITVSIKLAFPASPDVRQTVRESSWEMTFHPPLLQQNITI